MCISHRHIIHFHIPSLPIALARISSPGLRNRPVVAVRVQSARAVVLHASHEAGRCGIFKGMSIENAKNRCSDLTVFPYNPEELEKACNRLVKTAMQYTPAWELSRPGHLYLDLTGTKRLWGHVKDAARHLKEQVRNNLSLSGTVGVASNKMVSHIASRIIPPGGVLDVDHGKEASFMAPLKVDVMPGIGRARRKMLMEELDVVHIRQLAALDMARLRLVFGEQACLIHERALGIDPTPVYPSFKKPVVSEEIVLSQDENDDSRLLGYLYGMVEKCSRLMRKKEIVPRKAGLQIRYSDQVELKRQVTLPSLHGWNLDLHHALELLFFKVCTRRIRVRYMKVRFWSFSSADRQLSLFFTPSSQEKQRTLITRTLDLIRDRYGDDAIQYGRTCVN